MIELEAAIEQAEQRMSQERFVWSKNDCNIIMADYVLSLTGVDLIGSYRNAYSDEETAKALQLRLGGPLASVENAFNSIGIKSKLEHVRGDVILADFGEFSAVGLSLGLFMLFKSPNRSFRIRYANLMGAWTCV
ncbi:DUF6950 family protein [Lentilitoribacter sp. EG35]|uniref:DUF6950 family protein n=1 Tax=Lentilitoribacter sp. EG35 TaxID=3234192 RepID=UPI00345F3C9D